MNDEIFRNMLKKAFLANLQMQNTDTRKLVPGIFIGTDEHRLYLEYHPSIKTDVTDEDMLLVQIDMALDAGDMEMFMRLTDELKGMGVLV
ncbi:IDEAL domain-containing protein [Sporosarcina sp. FSL K6-6792]|uniref:IDEAL domain-containing protein n=1 Tax=Sporosarcina sp. FSL K6-6792 TaxID=2921559 RepID=UPI0030F906C3